MGGLRGEEGKSVRKTFGVQAPQAKRRDVHGTIQCISKEKYGDNMERVNLLCVFEPSSCLMLRAVMVSLSSVDIDVGVAG